MAIKNQYINGAFKITYSLVSTKHNIYGATSTFLVLQTIAFF